MKDDFPSIHGRSATVEWEKGSAHRWMITICPEIDRTMMIGPVLSSLAPLTVYLDDIFSSFFFFPADKSACLRAVWINIHFCLRKQQTCDWFRVSFFLLLLSPRDFSLLHSRSYTRTIVPEGLNQWGYTDILLTIHLSSIEQLRESTSVVDENQNDLILSDKSPWLFGVMINSGVSNCWTSPTEAVQTTCV